MENLEKTAIYGQVKFVYFETLTGWIILQLLCLTLVLILPKIYYALLCVLLWFASASFVIISDRTFVARHACNRANHCVSLFDRIIPRLQREALNKQTKENTNLEKWIRSIRFFTGNLFSVPLMCLPFSLSYKEICCNFRSTNVKFRDTSFKKS